MISDIYMINIILWHFVGLWQFLFWDAAQEYSICLVYMRAWVELQAPHKHAHSKQKIIDRTSIISPAHLHISALLLAHPISQWRLIFWLTSLRPFWNLKWNGFPSLTDGSQLSPCQSSIISANPSLHLRPSAFQSGSHPFFQVLTLS